MVLIRFQSVVNIFFFFFESNIGSIGEWSVVYRNFLTNSNCKRSCPDMCVCVYFLMWKSHFDPICFFWPSWAVAAHWNNRPTTADLERNFLLLTCNTHLLIQLCVCAALFNNILSIYWKESNFTITVRLNNRYRQFIFNTLTRL